MNVKQENLNKFLEEIGEKELSGEGVKKKLMEKFNKIADEEKFNSLERFKDLIIVSEDWEAKGLLTNTMKKKRHAIPKRFETEIKNAYSKLF